MPKKPTKAKRRQVAAKPQPAPPKTRPITKAQVDALLTNIANAPAPHRDLIFTYALQYLNFLSGPITDDDIWEAALIGRQKILYDKGIPREYYDLRDDRYRKMRAERHATHLKVEVPSFREPMVDGGAPVRTIEHEPTPPTENHAQNEPGLTPPDPNKAQNELRSMPPDPEPTPEDSFVEISRAAHIASFLQHLARFG